jgi:hypothetical protein
MAGSFRITIASLAAIGSALPSSATDPVNSLTFRRAARTGDIERIGLDRPGATADQLLDAVSELQ